MFFSIKQMGGFTDNDEVREAWTAIAVNKSCLHRTHDHKRFSLKSLWEVDYDFVTIINLCEWNGCCSSCNLNHTESNIPFYV